MLRGSLTCQFGLIFFVKRHIDLRKWVRAFRDVQDPLLASQGPQ